MARDYNYTGQLAMYHSEIINFLKTCTIKFSPFTYVYGQSLINQYGYTDIEEDWNPYYKNLCGEYQSYNTPMYIYSKEDNTDILFSKELKIIRPRLYDFYKVPNKENTLLCKKYPNQLYLIKNIMYPVDSIETCINANEFDLLAYDDSLLYEYERENLLDTLRGFLEYVRVRWWTKEFVYEDLYPVAFYYMIWQSLPNVLLTQRLYNIGTSQVHPFHVWEYLISKGMNDYRDILTNKQALWLYRNLRWIYKNKGKNKSLKVLADNILGDVSVTLYGKDMMQQTKNSINTCVTVPEIISYDINNAKQLSDTTTIEQLAVRLYNSNLDHDTTIAYTDKQKEKYSLTKINELPTKFLELKKGPINTRWEELLYTFLIETTIYRNVCGQIDYLMNFNDNTSAMSLTLNMNQALGLLYYLVHKSNGDIPVSLPKYFATHCVYNKDYPTNIPTQFSFLDYTYDIKQYIDIDDILVKIKYTNEIFRIQNTFSDYFTSQFISLLQDIRAIKDSSDNLYVRAMEKVYSVLLLEKTHDLNLSEHVLYTEWLDDTSNGEIKMLIDYYDVNKISYETLILKLVSCVFPIPKALAQYVGMTEYIEKMYKSLKALFVQLCSYNVVFLDTDRERNKYIEITNLGVHMDKHIIDLGVKKIDLGFKIRTPTICHTDLQMINDIDTVLVNNTGNSLVPVSNHIEPTINYQGLDIVKYKNMGLHAVLLDL